MPAVSHEETVVSDVRIVESIGEGDSGRFLGLTIHIEKDEHCVVEITLLVGGLSKISHFSLNEDGEFTSLSAVGDTEASIHLVGGGESVSSRESGVPDHLTFVVHAESSGGVLSGGQVIGSVSSFEITTSVEMAVKRDLSPGANDRHLVELGVPPQTTVNLVELHDTSLTLVATR
jgi:hypothetical protein